MDSSEKRKLILIKINYCEKNGRFSLEKNFMQHSNFSVYRHSISERLPAFFSSGLVQDVRVGPDVGEALVVLQRPHELATCGLDFFRELHVGADVRFGSPHVGDEPWAGEGAEQVHGEDQQQRGQEEHQGN